MTDATTPATITTPARMNSQTPSTLPIVRILPAARSEANSVKNPTTVSAVAGNSDPNMKRGYMTSSPSVVHAPNSLGAWRKPYIRFADSLHLSLSASNRRSISCDMSAKGRKRACPGKFLPFREAGVSMSILPCRSMREQER